MTLAPKEKEIEDTHVLENLIALFESEKNKDVHGRADKKHQRRRRTNKWEKCEAQHGTLWSPVCGGPWSGLGVVNQNKIVQEIKKARNEY